MASSLAFFLHLLHQQMLLILKWLQNPVCDIATQRPGSHAPRHLSPSCINALKRTSGHVSVLWTSHLTSPGFDLMPSLTSVCCLNDTILAECASFLCPRTLSSLRSSTWDILPSLGLPCGPVYTAFKSLFRYVLLLNPNPKLTWWPN